jgi:hypothetical protein
MSEVKPDWRALFDRAIEEKGGVLAEVAKELDLSRTTVSLVANNKYPGRLDNFAKRVIEVYDAFDCPHLGSRVTGAACSQYALRQAPTSSAREARHWRACQACPKKPKEVAR